MDRTRDTVAAAGAQRIGFLLLPRCSLMALGSALDALTLANQCSPRPVYETVLASLDGEPVASGSGAAVAVACRMDALPALDALFLLTDAPLPDTGFDDAVAYLRLFGQEHKLVGGIGTGAWLLARAGLLQGHRAAVQQPYASLLQERFADTVVSSRPFEFDRRRATCTGGHAAFDMFLHHIGQTHGSDMARLVGGTSHAPAAHAAPVTRGQPKLTEALSLMQANIREPLATEDIAHLVSVSRRQLERLFKQHLDTLPSRFYLDLRLNRARQLLQQTSVSILQVGLNCGFSSGPHFSNAYRAHFGVTPRDQRSQHLAVANCRVLVTPRVAQAQRPFMVATPTCSFATFASEPACQNDTAWLT